VKNGIQVLQGVRQIKFGNLNIFIKKSNMVQPKYSPEEALQRVKLMMGYDTRKTLKENKETIEEQWKSMLAGAGAGAAAAGAVSMGTLAIPGAVVGGILGLVIDMSSGTASKDKITQLIQACTKNDDELGKKTMSDDQLDELSDSLYSAMNGSGTEEDDIKDVFAQILTIPDLCGLVDNYKDNYGDLVEWLDGDLDGDEEWRDYVALPLRKAIRASKEASKKTDEVKAGGDSGAVVGKGGAKSSYTPCEPNKYVRGCKSEVVRKVQVCLKQAPKHQTGNFGPITQGNLQKLGKGFENGFTDADVATICQTEVKAEVKPEVGGEVQNVNATSTDF
jgi:hypothetical protein